VGGLFLKNLTKMVAKLTDIEATILENCTLKEYLTIFSEKPDKKAKAANEVLREISLQDLKDLIYKRIKIAADIVKKYSGAKKAKLLNLDFEIERKANGLRATTLQDYNNYVVSVFRASEQKIDKNISMLDFHNLENQVQEEYKLRKIRESQNK
jgi:hypothetical protein